MSDLIEKYQGPLEDWLRLVAHDLAQGTIKSSLLKAADALERQEWVSVEERLPEIGIEVLSYCPEHGIMTEFMCRFDGEVVWDVRDATHWMPLPEPPEAT